MGTIGKRRKEDFFSSEMGLSHHNTDSEADSATAKLVLTMSHKHFSFAAPSIEQLESEITVVQQGKELEQTQSQPKIDLSYYYAQIDKVFYQSLFFVTPLRLLLYKEL